MGRINSENLRPGMVLSADVLNRGGRVLLEGGLQLTEKHICILRKWGVIDAEIENVTQEETVAMVTAEVDPQAFHEAEAKLIRLFPFTDRGSPFIGELILLCALRRVRQGTRRRL